MITLDLVMKFLRSYSVNNQKMDYLQLEAKQLLAAMVTGTSGNDVVFVRFEPNQIALISQTDQPAQSFDVSDGLNIDLGEGNDTLVLENNPAVDASSLLITITGTEELHASNAQNIWNLRDRAFEGTEGWSGTLNEQISFSNVDRIFGGDSRDNFRIRSSTGGGEIHGGLGNDVFRIGKNFNADSVDIYGDDGNDRFLVRGDRNESVNSGVINFQGGAGTDRLVLNDRKANATDDSTFLADYRDYELVDNSIRWRFFNAGFFNSGSTENSLSIQQAGQTHDLNYDESTERVRVNGTNQFENRFFIQPNESDTKFFINAASEFRETNLLAVKTNSFQSDLALSNDHSGIWSFENRSRIRFDDTNDSFDFTSLVGLTEEQARQLSQDLRASFRVVSIDGKGLPVTFDYIPKRINVSLVDGIVTTAIQDDGRML